MCMQLGNYNEINVFINCEWDTIGGANRVGGNSGMFIDPNYDWY